MMKSCWFMLAVIVMLAACVGSDEPRAALPEDYLPLAVGNHWNFKATGFSGNTVGAHREVADYVTLNNKEYYLVVTTYFSQVFWGSSTDSLYYRKDNDGFVYVYRKGYDLEENRYRLNAEDGDTWSYDYYDQYVADIWLKVTSIKIKDIHVSNCKEYIFDVERWADEEYSYTLAPGIGFLKEYSIAWGGGIELTSARINGQEIEF